MYPSRNSDNVLFEKKAIHKNLTSESIVLSMQRRSNIYDTLYDVTSSYRCHIGVATT